MIEQLLGTGSAAEFLAESFLKRPFSKSQGAGAFTRLASWGMLESILAQPDADVMVVKEGRRWQDQQRPTYAQARQLYESGYTVQIRNAERHHPELAAMAAGFAQDFGAPVDLQLFWTPGGQFGFGWHYDAEDVFILQAEGSKEYFLRKNTVNPWPLSENMPRDMRYEREITPVLKVVLAAGDWLYIPNGYWHATKAGDASISLAVGVASRTALDIFDFLRQSLLTSMLWRQRLPVSGRASAESPEQQAETMHALCTALGNDLAKTLTDPEFARSFLSRHAGNPST